MARVDQVVSAAVDGPAAVRAAIAGIDAGIAEAAYLLSRCAAAGTDPAWIAQRIAAAATVLARLGPHVDYVDDYVYRSLATLDMITAAAAANRSDA